MLSSYFPAGRSVSVASRRKLISVWYLVGSPSTALQSMDELVALGLQRRGVKGVSWRRWQYRGAAALDALGLGVCDASSGAA